MPKSYWARLKEINMFFQGRGPEHKCMRAVVKKLEKAGIPYAIVGGMAVNAHGYERTTNDVDLLMNQAGIDAFQQRFTPRNYATVPRRMHRFWDRRYEVNIDVLVTGNFPGSGDPGPVAYPDPRDVARTMEGAQVVDLPTLIVLKLAARRYKDFADVVSLIRANHLDETFLKKVHPSLRGDFIECLEEMRREELYEARQEEAVRRRQREEKYPPRRKKP